MSARKCSDNYHDFILHLLEVCFSARFQFGHNVPNATQDGGKSKCVDTTNGKLVRCIYETHEPDGSKCSNQETVRYIRERCRCALSYFIMPSKPSVSPILLVSYIQLYVPCICKYGRSRVHL